MATLPRKVRWSGADDIARAARRLGLPVPRCAWPFLDRGGTQLSDFGRSGLHGVLTNMDPATDWVESEAGLALDFDGGNDYVTIAHHTQLDAPASFTYSVLLYPRRTSPSYEAVFVKGPNTRNYSLALVSSTTLWIGTYDVFGAGNDTISVARTQNAWQRMTIVYEDTTAVGGTRTLSVYVDEVLRGTKTRTVMAPLTNTEALILAGGLGGFGYFDGLISEATLWIGQALAPSQVSQLPFLFASDVRRIVVPVKAGAAASGPTFPPVARRGRLFAPTAVIR